MAILKEKSSTINFREEFRSFDLNAVPDRYISQGEYAVYLKKNDKFFRVQKPGQFIDKNKLKKYSNIYYREVLSQPIQDEFVELFLKLQSCDSIDLELKTTSQIIEKWEKESFHDPNRSWDIISALGKIFYSHEQQKILEVLSDFAEPIYFRSQFFAASIIYLAIKNGLYHFSMLQSLYLVSLSMDLGLAENRFHFEMYSALEEDRKNPGAGKIKLLSKNETQENIDFYHEHAERSSEKFLELMPEFEEIRFIDLIRMHHWGDNPEIWSFSHFDELEQLVLIINKILPYQDFEGTSFGDIVKAYNQYINENANVYLKEVKP